MKSIIVGFSSPRKWKPGAELIKWWQGGTPYCHVYIRLYSNLTKQWIVYQAGHGSVHCVEYENFKAGNKVTHEFFLDVPEQAYIDCLRQAQRYLMRPYGYIGLVKIVLKRWLKLKDTGDDDASFHCSELVARLLPNLFVEDADYLEPVDIFNALAEYKLARGIYVG